MLADVGQFIDHKITSQNERATEMSRCARRGHGEVPISRCDHLQLDRPFSKVTTTSNWWSIGEKREFRPSALTPVFCRQLFSGHTWMTSVPKARCVVCTGNTVAVVALVNSRRHNNIPTLTEWMPRQNPTEARHLLWMCESVWIFAARDPHGHVHSTTSDKYSKKSDARSCQ